MKQFPSFHHIERHSQELYRFYSVSHKRTESLKGKDFSQSCLTTEILYISGSGLEFFRLDTLSVQGEAKVFLHLALVLQFQVFWL